MRLYASELNARFPANLNPCIRLVATDGSRTLTSTWDSAVPDCELGFHDLIPPRIRIMPTSSHSIAGRAFSVMRMRP